MNLLYNIPLTGEKPMKGWIIAVIVAAAVAVVGSVLYPKIAEKFEKKNNDKKDD